MSDRKYTSEQEKLEDLYSQGYKLGKTVKNSKGRQYQVLYNPDTADEQKVWVGYSPTYGTPEGNKNENIADVTKLNTPSGNGTGYSSYYSGMQNRAAAERMASYDMAEAARKEADALAEIQRKRGVVDSSTLYQQQKATYGANAEQLGRMGLTVSGYSDYLNSQAYAAGMAARQNANAQAADANRQALYTEQMAKLEADKIYNDRIADIETARYNQIQAEKQQQQAMYASLMEGVLSGTIPTEQVATYAKALGITDESKIAEAKNVATSYGANTLSNTEYEKLSQDIANKQSAGDFIGAAEGKTELENYSASAEQKQTITANNIIADLDNIIGSASQLEALADNIKAGKYGNASESIKKAYAEKILANTATMTRADFEDILNSEVNKTLLTEEAKNTLQADFDKRFKGKSEMKGVVNINASDFKMSDFGTFAGSKKENSEQAIYTSDLEKMIKGEIMTSDGTPLKEGDIIRTKYGAGTSRGLYRYDGNGVFVKIGAGFGKAVVPMGYEIDERSELKKVE